MNFAKSCKKRNIKTIAWVSAKNSDLENFVDFTMHLPLEGEICPFGLAPTTSTVLQLIFGELPTPILSDNPILSVLFPPDHLLHWSPDNF